MRIKKLFFQVAIVLVMSSIVGFAVNISLVKRCFQGEFRQSFLSSKEFPSIVFIGLSEAEDLFSKRETFFIDTRPKASFQEGHISGSLNIPYEEIMEEAILNRFSLPFDKTLVVYCDGSECQSSVEMAKLLHQYGFKDIRVFFGGWKEWTGAGFPVSFKNDSQ